MKRLIVFIIILFASSHSYGQWIFGKNPLLNKRDWDKQRVHWGYYLGFNSYNYKFNYDAAYYQKIQELKEKYPNDYTELQVKSSIGFSVGLVGNLRLMEYLDLRFEPGLTYAKRELSFPRALIYDYYATKHENLDPSQYELNSSSIKSTSATYLHFPLLLKFSALRTGNIRPYVVGGVSLDLNLGANNKADGDNYEGIWRVEKLTTNYEVGVGVDFYFEYFKFSPSIRGVFGINDELIRDKSTDSPWTGNIESMKSRGIFVNFTFH
ncbi:porin family protein [Myroides sp. N17-2]|uniref:type IX secretion/gliding motility protein PorT/SprT n=1 Tax=Myroides sp. N17-2 TaxID=2030799 RepID=UPI000EFD4433|nr:porin family protein [Myroides sp. N17-2]